MGMNYQARRLLENENLWQANRYAKQFLNGHELSSMLTAKAWKSVAEREIYVVFGLCMLTDIIHKPTLRLYFTPKKRQFPYWDLEKL
jgi:hypothetical protein